MTAVAARPLGRRRSLPILQWPTLLLNSNYRPLSTEPPSVYTVRWGIEEVHNRRVEMVEAWDEVVVRSARVEHPAPKVVALRQWVDVFSEPRFCRKNILLRDRYSCQYCGERLDSRELTYDHVVPKSRGGKTVWENVAAACLRCNGLKGDSLPNWSAPVKVCKAGQFRPLKEPRRPTAAELYRAGIDIMPDDHRQTFREYLYWHSPLEQG